MIVPLPEGRALVPGCERGYDVDQLSPVVDTLLQDEWDEAAIPILRTLVSSAKLSQRISEFIHYGCIYYGLLRTRPLLREELLSLHDDLLTSLAINTSLFVSSDPIASFYGLKSEYEISSSAATKLFKVDIQFEPQEVVVGELITISLAITSNFITSIKFSEISLSFSDDITVHRLVNDDESPHNTLTSAESSRDVPAVVAIISETVTQLDEANEVHCASLLFPPHVARHISYSFLASESLFSASPDPSRYVSKVTFRLPLSTTSGDAMLYNRRSRQLNHRSRQASEASSFNPPGDSLDVTTGTASGELAAPSSAPAIEKDVIFAFDSFFPLDLMRLFPSASAVDIMRTCSHPRICNFFSLNRPEARISLAPLRDNLLLQGLIKRIDLVFSSGEDEIREGVVYLECTSSTSTNAVFWSSSAQSTTFDGTSSSCHPLLLNSAFQPIFPLPLPNSSPHSTFTLPLHLRSLKLEPLSIRLLLSYLPSFSITEQFAVTKVFDLTFETIEPVRVKFGITSSNKYPRGLSSEVLINSVLRGDMLAVSASLEAPPRMSESLQIHSLKLILDEATNGSKLANAVPVKDNSRKNFQLVDGAQDMLAEAGGADAPALVLSPGEVSVGSTSVQCCGHSPSSSAAPISAAAIKGGKTLLDSGLYPPSVARIGSVEVELGAHPPRGNQLPTNNIPTVAFPMELLDTSVTGSFRSIMRFDIPPVQVRKYLYARF